ncbi:MAG: hypothetical protein NZO58_09410, partial [Gemmataceae bacterium]|nr:hypothetical protein [Gemmataceae bacterium]
MIFLLLSGGFLWLLLGTTSAGHINYFDFVKLAKEKKFSLVRIRGGTHALGELKEGEKEKLPESIKK